VLHDQFDDRSASQRELEAMRTGNAVDDELARLKAEAKKTIAPPR
jgi:phage shock protein A